MKTLLLLLGGLAVATAGYGQNNRLTDHNSLAWFVGIGDHKIAEKWTIRTEYQMRRANLTRQSQHQLARLGLGRTLSSRVKVSGGYTFFQSSSYGDHPAGAGHARKPDL